MNIIFYFLFSIFWTNVLNNLHPCQLYFKKFHSLGNIQIFPFINTTFKSYCYCIVLRKISEILLVTNFSNSIYINFWWISYGNIINMIEFKIIYIQIDTIQNLFVVQIKNNNTYSLKFWRFKDNWNLILIKIINNIIN